MTTINNPAITVADSIIHAAVLDVAMTAAVSAAVAAQPWLGLPIINQVFKFFVGRIFGFMSLFLEQAAAFAIIDAQTSIEAAQYQSAVNRLKDAITAGDPNATTQAQNDFKDTLRRLIHTDGS